MMANYTNRKVHKRYKFCQDRQKSNRLNDDELDKFHCITTGVCHDICCWTRFASSTAQAYAAIVLTWTRQGETPYKSWPTCNLIWKSLQMYIRHKICINWNQLSFFGN